MLKMFATQLNGLFSRIQEKQIELIEDGARLLAQATISNGKIYLFGIDEMNAVVSEALRGAEPLTHATVGAEIDKIGTMDRVLLITRYSTDSKALQLAKKLSDRGVPFVVLSSHIETDKETLVNWADVHIDLQLTKGLLPNEAGGRSGYPSSMAALFVYYGLKFTIEEILAEYE